jgi:hypothetical protein
MRKLIFLAVVFVVLLSSWQVAVASDPELPYRCIDLEKTGPMTAQPSEKISYHFWVHNCGDIPFLSHARVYDSRLNPWGNHIIWVQDLYPGQVAEFSMPYWLPADYCGEFTNDAWVVGYPVDDSGSLLPLARDDDSWPIEILCAPGTGTPG